MKKPLKSENLENEAVAAGPVLSVNANVVDDAVLTAAVTFGADEIHEVVALLPND